MIRQIPNGLTGLRLIFSAALMFLPVESRLFWICYGLCGLSDMLDGFLARRLGVETPVTDTVQGLLHGGESPREAVMRLMTRTLRQE